jgi:glycerate kinase
VNAIYLTGQTGYLNQAIPERQMIIIEAAQAHGMTQLPRDTNGLPILSPMASTSYGLGELIRRSAWENPTEPSGLVGFSDELKPISSSNHLVVTLGGSASTDAGAGALQALGWQFYSKTELLSQPLGGQDLCHITKIIPPTDNLRTRKKPSVREPSVNTERPHAFPFKKLTILTDVLNPLLGPLGTVPVFSPQKGATAEAQETLEAGIHHFHELMKKTTQLDLAQIPGAGAAGGLAYALMLHAACLGTPYTIQSGFDWYSHLVDLPSHLEHADWVISGEGCFDSQSFGGKSIGALIQRIQALASSGQAIKLALFCGKLDLQHMSDDQRKIPNLGTEKENGPIFAYALEYFQHFDAEAILYPDRVLKRAVNHWAETVLNKA